MRGTGDRAANPLVPLEHVRAGMVMTLLGGSGVLLYVLMTWERPHRSALLVISVLAFASAALFGTRPVKRLLQTRWAAHLWLGWTFGLITATAVGVACDGGAGSPLVPMFAVPLMFAALSYPPRMAIAAAVFDVLACALALGLLTTSGLAYTIVILTVLISAAGLCIWQSRRMQGHYERLETISRTDYLTEALNRRGFEERLGGFVAAYHRRDAPFTLLLFDLDDFKAVNDVYGHAAGDELLRWTAQELAKELRGEDALARLGGDEFAVLLAGGDGAEARGALERFADRARSRTELSGGSACCPLDGDDAETLYRVADKRLYGAKRGPRLAAAS